MKQEPKCVQCGVKESENKNQKYYHIDGFICGACVDLNQQKAIDAFSATKHYDHEFADNDELKCPYCGFTNEVDSEDYTPEDGFGERECYECGSMFKYTTSYSVTFSTLKTDEPTK